MDPSLFPPSPPNSGEVESETELVFQRQILPPPQIVLQDPKGLGGESQGAPARNRRGKDWRAALRLYAGPSPALSLPPPPCLYSRGGGAVHGRPHCGGLLRPFARAQQRPEKHPAGQKEHDARSSAGSPKETRQGGPPAALPAPGDPAPAPLAQPEAAQPWPSAPGDAHARGRCLRCFFRALRRAGERFAHGGRTGPSWSLLSASPAGFCSAPGRTSLGELRVAVGGWRVSLRGAPVG